MQNEDMALQVAKLQMKVISKALKTTSGSRTEPERLPAREVKVFRQRLKVMFRAMETKYGFCARQNYWCCMTCGTSAIEKEAALGMKWAFYHSQDADGIPEGCVCIAYGVAGPTCRDEDIAEAGRLVCEAAKAAGLNAEWQGDIGTRVLVSYPREGNEV
jgi:hypothetical protein